MSYFAFLARTAISATYFSVIGNVCKIVTILINYMIWYSFCRATLALFFCLCVCLFKPFLAVC